MGLGKTIQSIAFLNHLYAFENCRGPFLVIAPLSTLEHWKRTVEDWTNLNGVIIVLIYNQGLILRSEWKRWKKRLPLLRMVLYWHKHQRSRLISIRYPQILDIDNELRGCWLKWLILGFPFGRLKHSKQCSFSIHRGWRGPPVEESECSYSAGAEEAALQT
jgi:hypothetical protein